MVEIMVRVSDLRQRSPTIVVLRMRIRKETWLVPALAFILSTIYSTALM
jgi:hypothetical protein